MIEQDVIRYDLQREREERKAAEDSPHLSAKDAHTEMADRYADKAWRAREVNCEEGNPC